MSTQLSAQQTVCYTDAEGESIFQGCRVIDAVYNVITLNSHYVRKVALRSKATHSPCLFPLHCFVS